MTLADQRTALIERNKVTLHKLSHPALGTIGRQVVLEIAEADAAELVRVDAAARGNAAKLRAQVARGERR